MTRDEPRFDQELRAFLSRSYNLKATADYDTDPNSGATVEQAQQAIDTARRFIVCIAELLGQRLPM